MLLVTESLNTQNYENKTTTEIRQTRGDKLLHCDVQPNRHHNKPDSQIHIAKGKGTARKTLSVPAQLAHLKNYPWKQGKRFHGAHFINPLKISDYGNERNQRSNQ